MNNKQRKASDFWPILMILALALLTIGGAWSLYLIKGKKVQIEDIKSAEKIIDLSFTSKERKLMLEDVRNQARTYRQLRQIPLPNNVPPALYFNPQVTPNHGTNSVIKNKTTGFESYLNKNIRRPKNLEELAFYPITALAELLRTRQVSSLELTEMYLSRLKKYGPKLECIITLTEELAREQAKRADEEIAAGKYRGPLHGIPWGAKDLLATKGIRTTWGAAPYKNQIPDEDATVVKKLEEAGAVLLVKLTLGELAWGDVWFGGRTRNPWDYEQGSSGSSAGSAAATAAGLVGFALGSETWGSIVSPSSRCGVTGLRPTFGRVSRTGAMTLSWSMDKIGPIARTVDDCALIFQAIIGPDGYDLTCVDKPFSWEPDLDLKSIRVGYLKKEFERDYRNKKNDLQTLEILKGLGLDLIPFELPSNIPIDSLAFILNVEAAAAFDELTRNNQDDLLTRQGRNAWPNVFRQARLITAVEYIQANRLRWLLMKEMAERMKNIDVYVAPSFGPNLLLTNLTGHPAVVVPNGFDESGHPTSISFIGNLFAEDKALRVARAFQQATDFHLRHPQLKE
ncbi:MAG: amidase [Candidatus Aminicenantes bacterium]|nr:amidase [Candidatus Aminicenantes bacterium]